MNENCYRGVKFILLCCLIIFSLNLYLNVVKDGVQSVAIKYLFPSVKILKSENNSSTKDYKTFYTKTAPTTSMGKTKAKQPEKEIQKLKAAISQNMSQNYEPKLLEELEARLWSDATKEIPLEIVAFYYRKVELSKFTKRMQQRIYKLQHPRDCTKAKKLNCITSDEYCGFGCKIHAVSYCLIVGYSTKRVVLPVFESWKYSSKGWNEYFLPLTNCTVKDTLSDIKRKKPKNNESDEILNVPWYDYKLPSLPPAIPAEFAETLINLHSDPPVFWISQFIGYIMRYSPNMQKHFEDVKRLMNFSSPIVGIHIRRTDKLRLETELFQVEEYMKHVSTWFDVNAKKTEKRRVYLATDEPTVINDIILKYPDYEFLHDDNEAVRAKSNRYSTSSLIDIIKSLNLLSHCDFVVCTFSSNICRLVYELMQTEKREDVTNGVISLDTMYYFYGQQIPQQIAIIDHKSKKDEIELKVGDILDVDIPNTWKKYRNKFDGFATGKNLRTKTTGRYPKYKVRDKWQIVDFPFYET